MARSPPSVSRRLLLAVTIPLLLFFGLTSIALDAVYRGLTTAAVRQQLQQQLVALVTDTNLDLQGRITVAPDAQSPFELPGSGSYATVRAANGALLWSSPSLAGTTLALGLKGADFRFLPQPDGAPVAELTRGLQWQYTRGRSRDLVFTAAQSTAPQVAQLRQFRQLLAEWFGGLTLALLLTMAWMMRRALAPVRQLEREIADVESGAAQQLGANYPRELAGVTRGLNALLEAERNRITRYRDTLGNLAHSLKTPLAVIRAHLGAAEASSGSRESMQLEIDRMAQIVEHQLKRAGVGGAATLGQTPVPVLPLVTELRAALLKVHAHKDFSIDVDVPAELGFLGDAGDLLELLGNLLDNACKWCRTRVAVSARLDETQAPPQRLVLVVEDDGPGIAPDDRERVIERGVRTDEHAPGYGLGLAMVRETAGLYGGLLSIDSSAGLGGARVELRLPGR